MLEAALGERRDQASGLRRLFRSQSLRVLPVASAMDARRNLDELASAIAALGQSVLILDQGWCKAGTGRTGADLAGVLQGHATFERALHAVAPGVRRLMVGEGFSVMTRIGMSAEQLFLAVRNIESVDMVILATARPRTVAQFFDADAEFLVLAEATAAGVASAYQLLKSIVTRGPRVRLVFDDVDRQTTAEDAFRRIEQTASRFLGVVPLLGGWLPRESQIGRYRGKPRMTEMPAIECIARTLADWRLAEYPCTEATAVIEALVDLPRGDCDPAGQTNLAHHGTAAARVAGERRVTPSRPVRRTRARREW